MKDLDERIESVVAKFANDTMIAQTHKSIVHLHIKTFHIKQMFTCTSTNVAYCIRCSRCGLLYIGETRWRLGDRFVEHLRSVRNKRLHLPVASHFNSSFHSLDNMSILGLLQCHNDATQKLEEQH
eukprot:g27899.t1